MIFKISASYSGQVHLPVVIRIDEKTGRRGGGAMVREPMVKLARSTGRE